MRWSSVLRTALALSVLLSTFVAAGRPTAAQAVLDLPNVLPAVNSWIPTSSEQFAWSAGSRLIVDSASPELRTEAETLADDISYLKDNAPEIVVAAPDTAVTGDVVLGRNPKFADDEAYRLELGPITTIQASSATGVYWGTRTLLQLIRQQAVLPAGVITDAPAYPVRGYLLSIARVPVQWLDNFIRDMSYLKLNELTLMSLNINDADIPAVEAIAARRHVKLIGSVNAPKFATGYIPTDYRLTCADTSTFCVKGRDTINLDIMNPAANTWAATKVAEHAQRFASDTFHIGGDEYPRYNMRADKVTTAAYPALVQQAQAKYNETGAVEDAFRAYMNQANDVVRAQGKTARMWSDDITPATKVTLDQNIQLVHWWQYGLTPTQLAAGGYKLINANADYLYFNLGTNQNPPDRIWSSAFTPGLFKGSLQLPGGDTDPALLGIQASVWTSGAVYNAGQLERDLSSRMRPVAQKAWGSLPVSSTYAGALPTIKAVGRAPGIIETPTLKDVGLPLSPASPAVVYRTSQQLFTSSATGALHHSFWSAAQGQIGEDLLPAGTIAGRPIAFNNPGDLLSVFTRGANGTVRETTNTPGVGWKTTDWTAAAAANGFGTIKFAGDPAGFNFGSERHVFGADSNGVLSHLWWSPGDAEVHGDHWGGGTITGTPAALVWGRVQVVYARGSNGTLHRWWWQASDAALVQHQDLGIPVAAGTKLAAWTQAGTRTDSQGRAILGSHQYVALVDPDGHVKLWSLDLDGDQATVKDLTTDTSVTAIGGPAGYADSTSAPVIFVRRASDQHLIRIRVPLTGAVVASDLTTVTPGTPVAPTGDPDGLRFDGQLHAFAPAANDARHHWWSTLPDQPNQNSWK